MKVAGFGCARLRGGGVQGRHSIFFLIFKLKLKFQTTKSEPLKPFNDTCQFLIKGNGDLHFPHKWRGSASHCNSHHYLPLCLQHLWIPFLQCHYVLFLLLHLPSQSILTLSSMLYMLLLLYINVLITTIVDVATTTTMILITNKVYIKEEEKWKHKRSIKMKVIVYEAHQVSVCAVKDN